MFPTLKDINFKLANNDYSNKDQIRFSLVTRIIQKSRWDIWNPNECCFEYSFKKLTKNSETIYFCSKADDNFFEELDEILAPLIKYKELEKRDLIESPFTLIHPNGIRGLFTPDEIKEILELTQKVVA